VRSRLGGLPGAERAGALTELLRESHAILRETRSRLPPAANEKMS
jgi:hypothetical protein